MALLIVVLLGSTTNINAQEDDECMFGPNSLKELQGITTGTTLEGVSQTIFTENYNDAVRQEEIKKYMDDNIDDLGIPEWLDSDIAICGIADDVVDKEKELGKTFEGKELERNIKLEMMKTSISALDAVSNDMN